MIILKENVERDAEAIKCPACKGWADRVPCTKEEINSELNCSNFGHGYRNYECCCRAFECCVCGERIVGTAHAPDYS